MPIFLGFACYATVALNECFHFMDWQTSMFTCYYLLFADSMFDTYQGSVSVSFLIVNVWSYTWIFFGINILINITLAQVEDGYVT